MNDSILEWLYNGERVGPNLNKRKYWEAYNELHKTINNLPVQEAYFDENGFRNYINNKMESNISPFTIEPGSTLVRVSGSRRNLETGLFDGIDFEQHLKLPPSVKYRLLRCGYVRISPEKEPDLHQRLCQLARRIGGEGYIFKLFHPQYNARF